MRRDSVVNAVPEPIGADLLSHWRLDPSVTYLDHGHFGATPRVVLEAQCAWRDRLETSPVEWIERRRDELLGPARAAVGAFIGADPQDLGFVTNTTGGVNAIVRSLRFEPGDQLLTTTHVYNAVRQTMRHVADRAGATHVEAPIPFPIESPQSVIDAVDHALTDRTRIVVIDHVASPTALVFPIESVIKMCAERGVDVIVDGAHAPGMVDLDVQRLGPAYYVGNLHKWVCAPKGSAFLWARRDKQQGIHPTTISHFLDQGFAREFGWQGTRDISAWLSVPEAIEFMNGFKWERVRRHNHELATWVHALLADGWGTGTTSPPDGSMLGAMVTLLLPEGVRRYASAAALGAELFERHRIEVPIIEWDDRWWVRCSCQIYNTAEQYERLREAVVEVMSDE